MIWAAVVVAKDGNYEVTSGKVVSLFVGLLFFHETLVRFCAWLPYDMAFNLRFSGCAELSCDSPPRNLYQGICICEPRHNR